jgi:hypothetical protein
VSRILHFTSSYSSSSFYGDRIHEWLQPQRPPPEQQQDCPMLTEANLTLHNKGTSIEGAGRKDVSDKAKKGQPQVTTGGHVMSCHVMLCYV